MDERRGTNILRDHSNGILHSMNCMTDDIDESIIMKSNTAGDSLSRDILDIGLKLQVASTVEGRVHGNDKYPRPKLNPHRSHMLSARELSSSIIASENTHVVCSVSIAFLVVSSFIDYPLLGINIVNSKSIIALRPLYMLLMTDFTVLICFLALERRKRLEDSEDVPKGSGVNWDRAEKLLEGGLVAYQMVRAVFIDFSIYVVIVVCVPSLVTRI